MNRLSTIVLLAMAVLLAGCSRQKETGIAGAEESKQAKALLQGTWLDEESEEISFHAEGDSIYYPDSTSVPAYFRIIGDSLVLGSGAKYGIVKQTAHLFWFTNHNGDVVKLVKSEEPADSVTFVRDMPKVLTYTHQVKTDSVVMFGGERYHWYIAINPTKYKVTKRSYTDNGMEVENVYYDNIMHVSVFNGAKKLYSSDFRKQMYEKYVPKGFLEGAVLGNMEFDKVDAAGLHFIATLCIPDGASCYLVETLISYEGQVNMKLVEY